MKQILCIVGQSCSGKDTIAKYFRDRYKLKPVCSYTTRPKRNSETDGVEHYFISDEQADEMLKDSDNIVAYTKFDTAYSSNGYRYFTTVQELNKSDIYIIDPDGLQYLKSKCNDKFNIITVFVDADYNTRLERAIERNPDQKEAFEDRYKSENEKFECFKNSRIAKYTLTNAKNTTIKELFEMCDNIVKLEKLDKSIIKELFVTIKRDVHNNTHIIKCESFDDVIEILCKDLLNINITPKYINEHKNLFDNIMNELNNKQIYNEVLDDSDITILYLKRTFVDK